MRRRLAQVAATGLVVAGLFGAGAGTALAAERDSHDGGPSVSASLSPVGANVDLSPLTLDLNDNDLAISLSEGVHGTLLGIRIDIDL
ncbi:MULTISPECIES: hypothetical protein [unclassified Crossiella]|uniref:hypothetical protein n=1 Tax=unclassified Crossiella TaxID=2620835 RepID=UPI001FFF4A17|nr:MULTISPECIES: hypothetical protein [unclassified Crossiella]MCK2242848.1 hypothetical protein [Crossiella sp. S99.2]MCK2256725.1 hypothetical protein [Crossiella sp. S99.1]